MRHLHQSDHDFHDLLYRRFQAQERRLEREAQLAVTESTDAQERYSAQPSTESFCDGATLEEVGQALGVSRERARQIQGDVLNKLRVGFGLPATLNGSARYINPPVLIRCICGANEVPVAASTVACRGADYRPKCKLCKGNRWKSPAKKP